MAVVGSANKGPYWHINKRQDSQITYGSTMKTQAGKT